MTTVSAPSLDEIQAMLSQVPETYPSIVPSPHIPSNLASVIDHTLLAPNALRADIEQCCRDAIELQAATVCVNSSAVKVAVKVLAGSSVKPICTIGFPFGAGNVKGKVEETLQAKADGALEIDMVQNVGLLRDGKYEEVFHEIAAIALAAEPVPLKVIIETCYLTSEFAIFRVPRRWLLITRKKGKRSQSPLCLRVERVLRLSRRRQAMVVGVQRQRMSD